MDKIFSDRERNLYVDKITYDRWFEAERRYDTENEYTREHLQNAIRVAVREELAPQQRIYFSEYYGNRKSIPKIAEEYGVDRSVVSRSIKAARKKLYRVLRYAHPRLLNAQMTKRTKGDI